MTNHGDISAVRKSDVVKRLMQVEFIAHGYSMAFDLGIFPKKYKDGIDVAKVKKDAANLTRALDDWSGHGKSYEVNVAEMKRAIRSRESDAREIYEAEVATAKVVRNKAIRRAREDFDRAVEHAEKAREKATAVVKKKREKLEDVNKDSSKHRQKVTERYADIRRDFLEMRGILQAAFPDNGDLRRAIEKGETENIKKLSKEIIS